MSAPFRTPDPDAALISLAEAQMSAIAPATIDAVIAHGAAMLLRNPWRADRIIPGASQMTKDELVPLIERRLRHAVDMNRWIGLEAL